MLRSLEDDACSVLRLNATIDEALKFCPALSRKESQRPCFEIGTAAHPRPSRRIYRELTCIRHPQPQQQFNNISGSRSFARCAWRCSVVILPSSTHLAAPKGRISRMRTGIWPINLCWKSLLCYTNDRAWRLASTIADKLATLKYM